MKKTLLRLFPYSIILVSASALLGWYGDIMVLKSLVFGFPTMKMTTAIAFLCTGLILLCMNDANERLWYARPLLIPVFSLIISLPMMTFLVSGIAGITTGLENLFIPDQPLSDHTPIPGRPSVPTMTSFLLFSFLSIIALANVKRKNEYFIAIGCCIIATGALAVLGYLFTQPKLYFAFGVTSNGMALHTAVLFILMGISCILMSDKYQPQPGLEKVPTI